MTMINAFTKFGFSNSFFISIPFKNIKFHIFYNNALAAMTIFLLANIALMNSLGFKMNAFQLFYYLKFYILFMIISFFCKKNKVFKSKSIKLVFYKLNYFAFVLLLFFILKINLFIFQYMCIAAASKFDLDNFFIFIDGLLGFYWIDAYNYVNNHTYLKILFEISYEFLIAQLFFSVFYFTITKKYDRLFEFFYLTLISVMFASAISMFLPAKSLFLVYRTRELAGVIDYSLLRNGSLTTLDLEHIQGLVSFPSIHAASAVIFPYVYRHMTLLFPITLIINLLMLLSTPTQGGHYLVDVVFGLVLGFVIIRIQIRQWRNLRILSEE